MPEDATYSISELADLAGVTPRTIRYYLAQGLLPSAGQTGPGTRYSASHLARLRVIRGLQAEHLPLAEIRNRLADLERRRRSSPWPNRTSPRHPPDSALDYVRSVLRETPRRMAGHSCGPSPRWPYRVRAGRLRAACIRPARQSSPHARRASRRIPSLDGQGRRTLPVGTDRPGHGCRAAHPSAVEPDAEQAGGPSRDDRPRTPRGGPVMTEPTITIRTDRTYIRSNGKSQRFVLGPHHRTDGEGPHVPRTRQPRHRPGPLGLDVRREAGHRQARRGRSHHAGSTPRTASASSCTTTRSTSSSRPPRPPARPFGPRCSRLGEIEARGSTDLGGGWLSGCEQVASHLMEQG